MTIKTRSLLTFILLCSMQSFGQNIKGSVDIDDTHRPNAGKGGGGSGIVSTDLFTGTGSVNIPIYDYSIDGVEAGVSFNYAAKGLQVDEIASSIGLGWELQAGGYVVRDVNGLEDEVTLPISYIGSNGDSLQGYLVPGAQISQNTIDPKDDDKEQDMFHFNFGGRALDVVFKRNSSGYITYQTYPKSEVKIEVFTKDLSGSSYVNVIDGIGKKCGLNPSVNIVTFELTDEQGNRFTFDRGDFQQKEYHFNNNGLLDTTTGLYYPTQKWNLVQVATHSGHVITYEYEKRYLDYIEDKKEELYPYPEHDNGTNLDYDPLQIKEEHWIGTRSHIKKITYPNNITVTFNLNSVTRCDCPGNFTVESIDVEERYDNSVKNKITYQLGHSFFRSAGLGQSASQQLNFVEGNCFLLTSGVTFPSGVNLDSAKEVYKTRALRTKLDYINKKGTDNNTIERYYTFGYNTTALPYRLDYHKDFYGYYNGNKTQVAHVRANFVTGLKDSFFTSIPYPAYAKFYNNLTVYPSKDSAFGYDRSYDATYAKAWILTSVTNSMGGTENIYYQDYALSNPDSAYGNLFNITKGYNNIPIGTDFDPDLQGTTSNDGVCIWKVEHKDQFSTENATVTEYTLNDGIRFNRGGYFWYPETKFGSHNPIYTNYLVCPDKYFNGSNHGFSTVSVTEKGLNNNFILSKTTYTFSNLIYNDANGHPQSWIRRPTGFVWHTAPADFKLYRLGIPVRVQQYDEQLNEILRQDNFYEDIATTVDSIKDWRFFDGYAWKYLLLDFMRTRLTSTISSRYVYDPDASVTKTIADTITYQYDNNDNIKCVTAKNSKRETIKEYTDYNYDFPSLYTSNSTLNKFYYNGIQVALVKRSWKMGFNDSTLLGIQINAPSTDLPNYIYFVGATIPPVNSVRFDATYSAKFANPLSSANAAATSYINVPDAIANGNSYGSALLKAQQVTRYDINYKSIELKNKDLNHYSSFIYDTRSMQKLAEVRNARYDDIAFTSFEGQYDSPPTVDYDRGNWDFDPSAVNYYIDVFINNAMTGQYVYELQNGITDLKSKPLNHKKYNVSLWVRQENGAGFAAEMRTPGDMSAGFVSFNETNTVGDWKLFTASFTPDSGNHLLIYEPPGINAAHTYIDEVRLHPSDATMISYTYYPLFGLCSETSPDNYITYYDYDVFGRGTGLRDMRKNIIKKYEYSYDLLPTDDGNVQKPSATNNTNLQTQ